MAENSPSDILTSDWNPIVGCQRYSPGCKSCWWFDGIMPWQQRLGNLPRNFQENQALILEKRFDPKILRAKRGIIGVLQHGDLFWTKVEDAVIHRVLDVVDADARRRQEKHGKNPESADRTKYVLWTKRAQRMAEFIMARYPEGVPDHLACGVSVENQKLADERLPHLMKVDGWRFVMVEPMLGPIDLKDYIQDAHWVVVGSETGEEARLIDLDWVRHLRDQAQEHRVPFFVKQVGSSHKNPIRLLDGREWNEFPEGFNKSSGKKRSEISNTPSNTIHTGNPMPNLISPNPPTPPTIPTMPQAPLIIRPISPEDHDFVLVQAGQFERFGDYRVVFGNLLNRRAVPNVQIQNVEFFICEVDGAAAGFLAVEWKPYEAMIHGVAVSPAYQRRGVASCLLSHILVSAQDKGVRSLKALTAETANPEALAFFGSQGFENQGRVGRYPAGQWALQLCRGLPAAV